MLVTEPAHAHARKDERGDLTWWLDAMLIGPGKASATGSADPLTTSRAAAGGEPT